MMPIISVPSILYSCCETKICARWPALILIGFQTRQKMMSWQKYHYYITTIGSAGTKNKKKKTIIQKLYGSMSCARCIYVYIIRCIIIYNLYISMYRRPPMDARWRPKSIPVNALRRAILVQWGAISMTTETMGETGEIRV